MRKRIGNPSNETHGKSMRCYDWFAPPGTDPDTLPAAIEAALPGLKLFHRGDGVVNGYINTSLRPDGSLYVCCHLYDDAYPLGDPGNDPKVAIQVAPTLNPGQENQLANSVGEHGNPDRKIDGKDKGKDRAAFTDAGFGPNDGPMKD